jgi:hypothetical protein
MLQMMDETSKDIEQRFINDSVPADDLPTEKGPKGIIDKSKVPEKNKGFSAFCWF